jgi:uncharacterized protein YhaN
MKLIPSYQEFVDDMSLNGKISPELAESLAADFKEIESLNEGFLDSIKNTLSKTFLGSLSYINMIDKARQSLVKDQKDLLTKKYAYEDEMESLNNSLDQANKAKDTPNADRISKSITNKENEYKTYVNMVKKRIDKVEDTISKMIQGNKRRSEYYDAGKSEDSLAIAEFEYGLAKSRTNSDPKVVSDLGNKVRAAKEEAVEAKEEFEKKAKKKEEQDKEEEDERSDLSKQIEETESAIKEYDSRIRELETKRINSKNKKLSDVDQDRLESAKSSLKRMRDKIKNIQKAMKSSKKGRKGGKNNQNGSKKLETTIDGFLDKNVDDKQANPSEKTDQNSSTPLKVIPGGKSKPEPAKAQSIKNPK